MEDSFDKEKILECMFDPITSEILAELENEGKESSYLSQKSGVSEEEVKKHLSYLLDHGFVEEKTENGKIVFSANGEKLAKIIEHEENFDMAVDGLTKMDSYLN
ncbi:MAG: helix-turn-helix domain-containing protein [Nitrosopumilaceae archaeon]